MPTKKERLDALEADLRTLREELDDSNRRRGESRAAAHVLKERVDGASKFIATHSAELLGVHAELMRQRDQIAEQTARHDQAMEIVGTRIGELVERLDLIDERLSAGVQLRKALQTRVGALERTVGPLVSWGTTLNQTATGAGDPDNHGGHIGAAGGGGFPTGGAKTFEEVITAMVPPIADVPPTDGLRLDDMLMQGDDGPPRRGDRVRLEGSVALTDGWYDVVGQSNGAFQVHYGMAAGGNRLLMWIPNGVQTLKEIRRNAVQPEAVDDKDLDV